VEPLPPRFDSRDPRVLDDPYAVYRELRAAGPLARGGPAQWVVTRYADMAPLLRDRRLGTEYPEEYHRLSVGDGPAVDFFTRIVLDRDPPAHTRLRRLMHTAFSPALVHRLTEYIGGLVDELLAPARDTGEFDAVCDLAFPLPVMVVCELIGIPSADRAAVWPRATDLAKGFALVVHEHERAAVHEAVTWLREYVGALVDERHRAPADDLLSHLLAAEAGGDDRLTREEVVDNAVFLFFAGFETTMNLIATGCHELTEHPRELARLRDDFSLVPSAVEELLRFDAPIQATARLVLDPVEVAGRTIRPGRILVMLLGSGNRDERQFPDPDRLDVGRMPNAHVSFGGGAHFCLGASLARTEAQVAFRRLLETFTAVEAAGEPTRRPSTTFRSYESVPLAVKPS
jgi:cytochrome P450